MNDDFVGFSLAVKLNEKGFPQDVFIGYDEFGTLCIGDEHSLVCAAPTISQVLKWLRKEKKIYIEIFLYNGKYSCFVKSVTQICEEGFFHECLNDNTTDEEYDTYEQAALAGIEYVLDNLI